MRLESSCKHTCLPMTHCFGVRRGEEGRGGFSAQLAYMIHLTELSSLLCTATNTCLHHILCQYQCIGSRLSELLTNKTRSTTTSMLVWFHMLCCIEAAVLVTTVTYIIFHAGEKEPRPLFWGHILLQSNVFVQFTELMRRYELPLPHPCTTP